jgi:tRNA(His) 5'-end guanylyltransferase
MYEESVTVAELFEEELIAIEEQYDKLIEENTMDSRLTAKKLEHIIEYFKLRLQLLDYDMEDAYGVGTKQTLH